MVAKKYINVQNGIINLIASGNLGVGDALPTESELAKRFDVSIITVRRAVSNLEAMRMLKRVQGSGTYVLSKISERVDNGNIVYLTISRGDTESSSFESTPDVMEQSLLKRGYHLQILKVPQHPGASVVKSFKEVRGVIATGWLNHDWVGILNALSIPVVFIGSELAGELNVSSIDLDWEKMAYMLTSHFLDAGARRFGLITGDEDYVPALLMRNGFRAALESRGMEFDPSLVCFMDPSITHRIDRFLKRHKDLDALIIESGCYIHVLNSLFYTSHRPRMAILSSSPTSLSGILENVVEAAFKENIFERSVDLLMEILESSRKKTRNIRIEPYLCE